MLIWMTRTCRAARRIVHIGTDPSKSADTRPRIAFFNDYSAMVIKKKGVRQLPAGKKRKNSSPCMFGRIRQDLEWWNYLPVSWLGRITLVKLIELSRLLYPLRMVLILFSNRVLKGLNSCLRSSIWGKHKPRLKTNILYLPSSMGGLDFPNIEIYQKCSHPSYTAEWVRNYFLFTW